MRKILSKLLSKNETDDGPDGDVHSDPDANIGDERYRIRPGVELWGYDPNKKRENITIMKQVYSKSGTHSNGAEYYDWRSKGDNIFRGTVEEWGEVKENPEEYMDCIPVDWDEIVEHMDNFIEMNGEYIYRKEYPHSILEIDDN